MKKVIFCICLLLIQSLALASLQTKNDSSANFMNTIEINDSGHGYFNSHTRYQNWNGTVEIINKTQAITKTYCSSADCDAFVRLELNNSHAYCLLHVGSDPTFRNIVEVLENGQHGLHCTITTKKQTNSGPFNLYDSKVRYTAVK